MSKNNDGLEKIILKLSRLILACNKSTHNLFNYAFEDDLENCDLESKNRERLIKIIKEEYLEVKKKVILKNNIDVTVFMAWEREFDSFVKNSAKKDLEILNILKATRGRLQKAIASVYKIRKKIHSYSLNSIPK